MRVAITGGSGFIGANLARRVLADGHEVHLFLRHGHDPWRITDLGDQVRIHLVDIADAGAVAAAFRASRPEWVFHLAAYGAYPSQRDPDQAVRTNVLGTIHLLDAARANGVAAFVAAGSSSEYGFTDHAPSEDDPPRPNSLYAVTKVAAAAYTAWVSRRDAARAVTLRLYSAFGPWEEPTRFVPQLVLAGLDGRLPPLVDPRVVRDFVHVDDVCDAFVCAATAPDVPAGALYNIGTAVQTSIGDAVGMARELMRVTVEPDWGSMPQRSWDTSVWVADPRRAARDLGWVARTSFGDGLARTIEWFRDPQVRATYARRLAERS